MVQVLAVLVAVAVAVAAAVAAVAAVEQQVLGRPIAFEESQQIVAVASTLQAA